MSGGDWFALGLAVAAVVDGLIYLGDERGNPPLTAIFLGLLGLGVALGGLLP